jgi:Fe-S-cluster formation regulator IscX/YfhJ
MRTVRRTDMTKLIKAFRNFANAPKKSIASNSVMCALQQIRQTGQISKDAVSVVH